MADIRRITTVPSVASEPNTHSIKPHTPRSPRPQSSSERAPATPFERLLDDGAQSAAPPAPPPKTAKSERAEPDRPRAPGDSGKPAKRADRNDTAQDAGNTEKSDTADQNGEQTAAVPDDVGVDNEKAFAAAAATQGQAASDDTSADKTDGDGKSNAGDGTGDATADAQDAQNTSAATPTPDKPAVPVAAAPPPIPADSAVTPAADEQAAPVTTAIALAPAEGTLKQAARLAIKADTDSNEKSKEKSSLSAPQNADTSDAAAKTDSPANTAPAAQTGAKPNTDDKQAVAQFGDEVKRGKDHIASKPESSQTAAPTSATPATKPATDVTQTLTLNPTAQGNAASNANAAAAMPPAQTLAAPVPLAGLPVAIATKALEGKNRFEIRLDPPELGRIEVRLDVDKDGKVTSQLVAHRPETLDLLRRDAAGLQRALEDAGLKTADNGLQFSLHDQSANRQQDDTSGRPAQIIIRDETLDPIETASSPYARLAQLRGGLDIRV
jgi:flagellar hook-length control protein FliK